MGLFDSFFQNNLDVTLWKSHTPIPGILTAIRDSSIEFQLNGANNILVGVVRERTQEDFEIWGLVGRVGSNLCHVGFKYNSRTFSEYNLVYLDVPSSANANITIVLNHGKHNTHSTLGLCIYRSESYIPSKVKFLQVNNSDLEKMIKRSR